MVLKSDRPHKFSSIWAFLLICTLIIIISLYFININLGIKNFSNTVSLPIFTIIPGTLVIVSFWAVTRAKSIKELPRNSLIFLSVAFTFWFLAEQTWNLYEHVFMLDPYPSIADFFYFLAPIFMLIGLSIFLKSTKKKISKKKIIFASLVSSIILIPTLISILEIGAEDEPLEIFFAVSYPIADAVLLVPTIVTILFLISNKLNFFWLMILSGIIIMLAADSIFLFLVIENQYEDGHPVDILWVSAYTIWSFMMVYLIFNSKKIKENSEPGEIYEKYGSKKIEKYGIFFVLLLINLTVAILLAGINYFANPEPENTILPFFSWIFVMTVIIFSSIVILLNSKLNKILQSRTLQLEKTSKELIKSERFSAIGELAARISHDIRTPLSNLQMSIELMKKSAPGTKISDKTINEKLELASKNIERISHQINNVLGFVKDRQTNKERFRVSTCFYETIESINIPDKIKIKISKSDIFVFADKFQIQIVFNNILVNAIQAIGKDPGEILIKINEERDNVKIKITNSGPSIPDDLLPHIFDSLVTTKQVGTGLGLVSCKTIIKNHGGSIVVKNNPTEFLITLPKIKLNNAEKK